MPPDRSDEGWRDAALLLNIMLAAFTESLVYASTYSAMLVGAGTAAPSALRPSM
jgi:hypothetical protein